MAKSGLTLDHAGQFKCGETAFVTRYGEREDWGYPLAQGAVMTSTGRISPVPAMPEVTEVTFLGLNNNGFAMVHDDDGTTWWVRIGYVKTAKWVAEWTPLVLEKS